MKKLAIFAGCLGGCFTAVTLQATDLKQSKVTQVVNDVRIISAAEQKQTAAVVNDLFSMPDILRTGAASRAELVAPDETVTRVGANTIFSFDPASRSLDLKQGSLLFHSPHGQGGGTIHTGSATASVLGTTLIVSTTANGGLKVLDLEGQVKVRLSNGRKQKLGPGQMTFILPGTNVLAPVIVFRLDELTKNSLLLKGFDQTLASQPEIQRQVDKQLKLIKSGRATDTGLYAGDDASADAVEVLDPNTVSHATHLPATGSGSGSGSGSGPTPPPDTAALRAAEASDAWINQSSLTDSSIPTPPNHIITTPFSLSANDFFGVQTFAGFVARNIYVNTLNNESPSVIQPKDEGVLGVNLSPYASMATFDLVAVKDFYIEGPVSFDGLTAKNNLALIAGDSFVVSPYTTISASANNFLLSSRGALLLDEAGVYNTLNNLSLVSGDDIQLLNNSVVSAAGRLTLRAGNDISFLSGARLAGNSTLLTSLSGSIVFDNSTLDITQSAIFIAPRKIELQNSTLTSDSLVLNGTTGGTISIDNTTVKAATALIAVAVNDLSVTSSTLNTSSTDGTLTLNSALGSVTVKDTAFTAHTLLVSAGDSIYFDGQSSPPPAAGGTPAAVARFLKLNSGDGILLTARGSRTDAAGETAASAKFTAVNLVEVRNTDLTSFGVVNMAANTLYLYNVAFAGGSLVNLRSALGQWYNISGGIGKSGYVNAIGVTYGGNSVAAENGYSGTISGTGITISKK